MSSHNNSQNDAPPKSPFGDEYLYDRSRPSLRSQRSVPPHQAPPTPAIQLDDVSGDNEELNFGTLGSLPGESARTQGEELSSQNLTTHNSQYQHTVPQRQGSRQTSNSTYSMANSFSEGESLKSLSETEEEDEDTLTKRKEPFSPVDLKNAHLTPGGTTRTPSQQSSHPSVRIADPPGGAGGAGRQRNKTGRPRRAKTVFRRDRWGTQRQKNGKPVRKNTLMRQGTLRRAMDRIPHAKRLFSGATLDDVEEEHPPASKDEKDRSLERRTVYWNMALHENDLDEDGNPPQYPRNKIRTTKYTPLSFVPKNLFFQFKNVANIYFLTTIVLGFFNIFGVPNPALSAVPLVVIVCITAFKDALEDSRRTISDVKINNMITHVARGIDNPNFNGENISLWRRFKKMNTRVLMQIIHKLRGQSTVNPLMYTDGGPRKSIDSFDYRMSLDLANLPAAAAGGTAGSTSSLTTDPFGDSHAYNSNNNSTSNLSASAGPTPSSASFSNVSTPVQDRFAPQMRPFTAPRGSLPQDAGAERLSFRRDYWKNVHVGDVLKIKDNDQVPVDVLLLATSDSDGGCYVETKNLDGETNLKVRQALKCSSSSIRNVGDLRRCKFWLESEGPKANLYSYEGNFKYYVGGDEQTGEVANEAVTINNFLLRGCSLRNTKWAVGVVIFTGPDTKIMLNAGVTPTKKSRISTELNWQVVLNFALLFVISLISGLVNGINYRAQDSSVTYFEYGTIAGSPAMNGIVCFFVAVILYSSLVPISLYISIEIIKTAQAFFIYSDVHMYYERLDYPCTPKSWSISDDLGQVEYIFSDKTGTLTQNVMEFKKCTIAGKVYGRAYTEAYAEIRRREGVDVEEEAIQEKKEIAEDKKDMIAMLADINTDDVDVRQIDKDLTFVSKTLVQDFQGQSGATQQRGTENFFLALALCHSVLAEKSDEPPYRMEYRAQSPDEAALVATARDVGYEFVDRTKSGIIIKMQGVRTEYQILNILEFNSTRKRMSVIIKVPGKTAADPPRALLICKGADSIIFSRLSPRNRPELLEKTAIHLEQFATEGLRTLCVAQRELSWDEYQAWNAKHHVASSSLDDREEKMEQVASEIERQLFLLGGTAIEDRLQDGVPESIQLLARAGIKLWVLTGDKVETAINIGFSCNLLQNDMQLLVIRSSGEDVKKMFSNEEWRRMAGDKPTIVSALISKYLLDSFDMLGSADELAREKNIHQPPAGSFGIVIDGDALKIALGDDIKIKFLLLCKQCKAVLCCRVSPAQKAAVVRLVKDNLDVMTLAIGDGSNDVAMIQAANVGVGIAGEEGTQATMSADYAVGQFRYLAHLVLVHGRWSYKRLAEMIPSFFYKNVVFTLALFWYGIYDDFDGTYMFEYTYLMFYNLAFTSLPVIFLGIFDQDVDSKVSLVVPQLYRSGILRLDWNNRKFVWYMIDAFYESVIAYFIPHVLYQGAVFVTLNGLPLDHRFLMGAMVATISIAACDLYVLMHQKRWDWLSVLITSLSILLVFAWTGIWSSSTMSGFFYKSAVELYSTPAFWACFVIGSSLCLMPRVCYDFVTTILRPKDIDLIREQVSMGTYNRYPDDYDPTDPNRPRIAKQTEPELDDKREGTASSDTITAYGTPEKRGSIFSRMFTKKPATPHTAHAGSSANSLETEEIELEFTSPATQRQFERHNGAAGGADADRHRSLERTRTSLEYSRTGEGAGRGTSFDHVRASLDLSGINTAKALIDRTA